MTLYWKYIYFIELRIVFICKEMYSILYFVIHSSSISESAFSSSFFPASTASSSFPFFATSCSCISWSFNHPTSLVVRSGASKQLRSPVSGIVPRQVQIRWSVQLFCFLHLLSFEILGTRPDFFLFSHITMLFKSTQRFQL